MVTSNLPEFLRISQIVSDKKKGVVGLLPFSRSTWWSGVKSGIYPQPVKLSERVTAWRRADIESLIRSFDPENESQA